MNGCLISIGLIALLASCQRDRPDPTEGPAPSPTVVEPSAPPRSPTTKPADVGVSGQVVETMSSGGYTYARLDRGDAQFWVAGPETKLVLGTRLGRMEGALMPDFRSDTLKRTFDEIYFVNAFAITDRPPAAATASPPATPADDDISGTVLETMNAGGYTYAHLDHGATKIWIAGPETKLAVGTKLGSMTGSLMTNFRSDTLDRTFDQIYFVSSYGADAMSKPTTPHGDRPATADDTTEKIAPVPGGKTLADIVSGKAALAGKPVVVRGKIVKVSLGILGRNWIHLRDGGPAKLLVTTQASPKVGDIVVARGRVAIDKDFGGGYRYEVLVEDATLAGQ